MCVGGGVRGGEGVSVSEGVVIWRPHQSGESVGNVCGGVLAGH